jgi:hypothetical protein
MLTWDDVVKVGMELPEVLLSTSYGTPALKVRSKLLIRLKEDDEAIVVRTPDLDAKEALLAIDTDVFFTTAHYDGHAWVLVRLARVRRPLLRDVVREAYVAVAPKKLIAALPKAR